MTVKDELYRTVYQYFCFITSYIEFLLSLTGSVSDISLTAYAFVWILTTGSHYLYHL